MLNLHKDIIFCSEYLQFCKSIEVVELTERYIAVAVKMHTKKPIPITTFYLEDYACDMEYVFRHFYTYVQHK